MVSSLFLPVPYVLVMLYALVVPNGKNRHVGYLGCLAGIVTFVMTWIAVPSSVPWFAAATESVSLTGMADAIAVIMAAVVAAIGAFVFLYSVGYFEKGEDLRRYYAVLALFAWSMLGVVLSDNLFQLFFCWELVGVSSFLLIGFWYRKPVAQKAAKKAFLTIILGDAFFLAGIMLLIWQYGTFTITDILAQLRPDTLTTLAGVGLIGGAISKSAQFPLHDWLADAMAGPTPVSAFLHSATMVKAGLFVVARFLPLLVLVGLTPWLAFIAVVTILISGVMALTDNDIKRVLAYSTMNQLAFILLAFSLGAVAAGMFHLVTHSIFKALLFFLAGVIIHTVGTQDLRQTKIRWSWAVVPLSALAAVLALAGMVPFSGFFSKETIFEAAVHAGWEFTLVFMVAIVLSAGYIARWFFMIFHADGKQAKGAWQMTVTLPVLAVLAVIAGILGPYVFGAFGEHMPSLLSWTTPVSLALVVLGGWLAYNVHVRKRRMTWLTESAFAELGRHGFLFDDLYTIAGRSVAVIARVAAWFDDAAVNRIVRNIGNLTAWVAERLRKLQTGHVQTYVVLLILGFVLLAIIVGVLA